MIATVGLVWRQLAKDTLRARWLLLMLALVLTYATWLAIHPGSVRQNICIDECGTPRDAVVATVVISMYLLLVLLGASVVQSDSPTRHDAFWISQPIPPLPTVFAKLLFVLTVVAVAVSVGHVVTMSVLGFSPRYVLLTVLHSLYVFSSAMLLVMAVASVTPSIKALLLTLAVGAIVALLLAAFVLNIKLGAAYSAGNAPGLRGDVWAAATVSLLAWIYVSRHVGIVRRRVAALSAVVLLGFLWEPATDAPMRVFSRGTAPENPSLPMVGIKTFRQRFQYRVDLEVAAPAPNHRYRYVNVATTLLFRDGTAFVLHNYDGRWVLRPEIVMNASSTALIDDRALVRAHFSVDMNDDALARMKREDAVLVVDGLLEEQERFRVGNLPIVPGQSVQFQNERFTIRNAPADTSPYYLGLETVSLAGERRFGRVIDDRNNQQLADDSLFPIPWYVNTFTRELPPEEVDLRVVFNASRDTVALLGTSPTQTNTMIPLSTFDLRRSFDRYSVRNERGGNIFETPNWISDGTLLISQWRYLSHKSVRAVLHVRAQ